MRTALVIGVVLLATACFASPADRVNQEIARLEKTLTSLETANLPDDVKDLIAAHRGALERAKKATSPEYKLYRLRDPFIGIETLSFLAEHPEARVSVETVEKLWRAEAPRFAAKAAKPHGTLLERALTESAMTRSKILYDASMAYAKVSSPWSGVYYLGEGAGNLRFRDFLLSATGSSTEASPVREQVAAILASLDKDTLAFFGNDVTNQAVIPVSVRLKEAHELLNAGRVDGAMLLLIEARAALSRRGGPKGSYSPAKTSPKSMAAVLEAWSADEQPPMSDALKAEVPALYASLFNTTLKAAAATKPSQVTVTLVRWPYT